MEQRISIPPASSVLGQLINFACAMIGIETTDGSVDAAPSAWVIRQIIDYGRVGFYDTSNKNMRGWWIVNELGELNRYGLPRRLVCRTEATTSGEFVRPAVYSKEKGMKLLRANALMTPPRYIMEKYARVIEEAETLLRSNIEASRHAQVLTCPKSLVHTVEDALEDATDGLPAIIEQGIADQIGNIDISVPFYANDIHSLITSLYADAIKRFGGVTPTQYKAERVQSAEVSASVAEAIDNIYIMIDTLNEDCERYGVPRRFFYRGFGAVFDRDIEEKEQTETGVEPKKQGESEEKPNENE